MATRRMAPVPRYARPFRLHKSSDWVPLPEPGEPRKMTRMTGPSRPEAGETSHPDDARSSRYILTTDFRKASRTARRRRRAERHGPSPHSGAAGRPSVFRQPRIVAHHQMAVDLLHQV